MFEEFRQEVKKLDFVMCRIVVNAACVDGTDAAVQRMNLYGIGFLENLFLAMCRKN